jgi:hypothetical protein
VSTLLHATIYMFLHNLLNVLVQIANKMGLQKKTMQGDPLGACCKSFGPCGDRDTTQLNVNSMTLSVDQYVQCTHIAFSVNAVTEHLLRSSRIPAVDRNPNPL